jgi:hypothetical protein
VRLHAGTVDEHLRRRAACTRKRDAQRRCGDAGRAVEEGGEPKQHSKPGWLLATAK